VKEITAILVLNAALVCSYTTANADTTANAEPPPVKVCTAENWGAGGGGIKSELKVFPGYVKYSWRLLAWPDPSQWREMGTFPFEEGKDIKFRSPYLGWDFTFKAEGPMKYRATIGSWNVDFPCADPKMTGKTISK
jgi:hypothetical protein